MTRFACAVVASVVMVASVAIGPARVLAAPAKPSKPVPAAPPPPPLSMLPSIARVRLEVSPQAVVVMEEVNLPRGEWKGEALDFYVAFGAPGAPRAIDAHILAVEDGALEAADADVGEALAVSRAPRRPTSAHALLGRETMAGVVVHVPADSMRRALTRGNMAALRFRSVLDPPEADATGARGVLVRLGASRGVPLTLGRVSVLGRPGASASARAEARLCGPEADPSPLAVSLLPKPSPTLLRESSTLTRPVAPVLAVRHATDDLCIRFWMP